MENFRIRFINLRMSPNCLAVKQSSRPSPIHQSKQQPEPVPMEVEVMSPLKSPPPDPSCLPPPVISEQDLHSMFGQPITESQLHLTNITDPLPEYKSLDLLSSSYVAAVVPRFVDSQFVDQATPTSPMNN